VGVCLLKFVCSVVLILTRHSIAIHGESIGFTSNNSGTAIVVILVKLAILVDDVAAGGAV